MLSIGEFAQLTGLSAKALRIYDKQGLLKPAEVDPWSNYRRYSASQLESAIQLKALRAAEIGLAEAQRALRGRQGAAAVLAEHRERLAAERARQDEALAVASALLERDPLSWDVQERQVEAQHWVGVVLPVTDELTDDQADLAFGALHRALAAAENAPTGPFWSSMRAGAGEDDVELLCCWPVARAVAPDWSVPGASVVRGEIRAGRELVVGWRHDDGVPVVDSAVHPAVLVLLAEAERRGAEAGLAELRQIGLLDETGDAVGVEVAIPLI
ncbi:DNA-binding transcriptional regulator, MerR family [Saccharopolyspora kobensis]|uniref:DNA-binding transcriptional regulator, MerR family n=1 Tax=Saccharopolyspora kobensis TaxID=146035 RepID=A0A1H6DV36_9PSEU|nr:MerR family transcriptional regulator [Saccharopolyspora kobensis]SEG88445.1 DNA-binding transcriptional regulator, MerR family [Saccharopolyspora kobensis]SFE00926.1 DNA-binding transcriptional regulator, MerR family [Saccharopolyspora kobensis]